MEQTPYAKANLHLVYLFVEYSTYSKINKIADIHMQCMLQQILIIACDSMHTENASYKLANTSQKHRV